MSERPVVIIGAGIAGLAAALRLAAEERPVVVYESAAEAGGKMRQVRTELGPVDSGPTVFTMRTVFEELLAGVGRRLEDVVTARPLELLARHAWDRDARLDLYADRERSAEAIGDFAGAAEALGYRNFCREAGRMYEVLEHSMLRASRPNPLSLSWRARSHGLSALWGLKPLQSMWRALGHHFKDVRLQQLFGRYATYCGSSPWQAPATLMLIAHVEQEGVWQLDGGMQSLAAGMARAAAQRGVEFRHGETVEEILLSQGRASAVRPRGGDAVACDGIICTADPAALRSGLLGPDAARGVSRRAGCERSLSAVTWAGTASAEGFPLSYHNVFFSADYAAEFRRLFGERRLPDEPTVYLCAQDRDGLAGQASDGEERIFLLVNAPANGDSHHYGDEEIAACERQMLGSLKKCGLRLNLNREALVVRSPGDFATRFPGSGGAIYGQATHGMMAPFRRPGARSRVPGLYLAGGGVHPGAGVPMVALSGAQAASSLMRDRALTRRWWPTATAGGTSMR
jgi:1-hydroxycarotenoid 3,4-desaturase